MSLVEKISRRGVLGSARIAARMLSTKTSQPYHRWRVRNAPRYVSPMPAELCAIERDLVAAGIAIHDYAPSPRSFAEFRAANYFPSNYHGGRDGGVWDEKLLEHWIAAERLGVIGYSPSDIYVDVAAGGSPWAKTLRQRHDLSACAIDQSEIDEAFQAQPFYRREDATATSFANASVSGASLYCAYEIFNGDDDIKLVRELARILKPGGKVVILPLYLHKEYCFHSTPEYYGKGYSDPSEAEYVRTDCFGIPASRKYDARTLRTRVLDEVERQGMTYRVLALRNKSVLGKNIYCHFILEIIK